MSALCSVQRLLVADDLVLLDSTQNGLQQAFGRFSDACPVAEWKSVQQKEKPYACPENSDLSKLEEYH